MNNNPHFLIAPNLGRPGTAIIPVGDGNDYGSSVTVQPDGKIVVAGKSYSGNSGNSGNSGISGGSDFSLIRLYANGSLDTSFNGTGKAIIDMGGRYDIGSSVTLQTDGKIVVAGFSNPPVNFSLIRLNANGSLDTSFNGTGKAIIDVGGGDNFGNSVTVQPDGKIVAAGYSYNGNGNVNVSDFRLTRLNADGSPDTSFNGTGKAIIDVGGGFDFGHSVALQSDGKIVVAGYSENGSTGVDFSLIRLNANGSLDTSFNGTGKAIIDMGGRYDYGNSVTIQSDGKIVVAGISNDDFSLIRLNANGSLDTSFNGSGKAIIDVGGGLDVGYSVVIQSDGKIVVAGDSIKGSSHDFSLIRLNANGSLDTSFNGSGKAIIDVGGGLDAGYSVTIQSDGKIVLSGTSSNGGNLDFSLIRLNANGSLDTSFNPASDALGGTVAYVENAPAIALDSAVAIFDAELGALSGGLGNYAGTSVTLARQGGSNAQDLFSALGNLSFSGGNAVLAGITIGTVSNVLGTLSITFNSAATQAVVNEVLSSIGYANRSDAPPASVQVSWTFNDGNTGGQGAGGSLTGIGSTTVNITAVNDAHTGRVSIRGSAVPGQTLTASNTLADADGLGTVSYQWLADGVNIAGATAASYTLDAADLGKTLSVRASYTDGGGTLETAVAHFANHTLNENTKIVTTVTASDALLDTAPKYTLTGADGGLFKVSSKGVLTFAAAKDYEQPVDANHDGVYEVSVTMTNTKTHYAVTKDLTIGVEFAPIQGTTGNDTLKGTAGWDTLDGLAGDDKLTGGTGLDTFLVTSGHDTILDFNALSKGATGSEILQVSAGATADATLKAAWTATSDSFNDGTANLITKGMAVDLSGITHGQGWNMTNAGAATTITGSQFNDVVTGGAGNDILISGAGNDVLIGGKGSDTLTGGVGADTFRLSGDTKTDHITDFVSGTDRIELDHLLYKALGTGPLAANQFVQGTVATTTTQRIVYDQPTGNLWYDADGSGKGKAILIGVMENHVQIAHTDLYLI